MAVVMARLDRLDATTHSLVTRCAPCTAGTTASRMAERLEGANREAPSLTTSNALSGLAAHKTIHTADAVIDLIAAPQRADA